jgi:hypothetical protein
MGGGVVVVSRPRRWNIVVGEPVLLTEDVKFARERAAVREKGATAAELGSAGVRDPSTPAVTSPTRFAIESSALMLS